MSDLVKELGNWTIDTDARLESLHRRLNRIEEITLDQRDVVVMGLARRICELEAARAKLEAQRPLAAFDESVATDLRKRIEALECSAVKRDMARGLDFEQVHPDEMMRLRRIEKAARELVDSRSVDAMGTPNVPGPMLRRLREVLGDA